MLNKEDAVLSEIYANLNRIWTKYNLPKIMTLGNVYSLGQMCDKINRSNIIKYPRKEDYRSYFVYREGAIIANGLSTVEFMVYKSANPQCVYDCVEDTDLFNADMNLYNEFRSDLEYLFVWGLKIITDTYDNPKADKAYSMAYDRSHSGGYEEVAGTYLELTELIK